MNPLVGQVTLVLILVILFLPRRWAALGVVSGVLYVTQSEFFVVGGIDFTAIRFIILVGFIRVVMRKEVSFSRLNKIDKSLLIFNIVYLLVFALRSQLNPSIHSGLMYQLGFFCDGLLSYFTFRGLLKDLDTFRQFLKDIAFLILPFTIFIIIEGVTGRNFFSLMGGVPETPILRKGYYRCQGSFRHAITAGTFGATLVPLFIGLARLANKRFWAVIGIILGALITIASHSSGPLMTFIGGVTAWMCWPLRERMRIVRWAIVGFFVSLAVVMKAPVWFIIDRVGDLVGAGDGWHRANLIDKFINSFWEWWLMGMPIEKTADWAATKMPWGTVDVTNGYVSVGINGGLISLVLFIWLFKNCYQLLGRAMEKIRRGDTQNDKRNEVLLWGLGSALFSHMMSLISVTYWDQSYVMWYMLLAVISSLTEHSNWN
jgi:hypothetical protein